MSMYGGRDSKWALFAAKLDKEGAVNCSIHVGEDRNQNTAGFMLMKKQGRIKPQKEGRSVVEGNLEANESSGLCCSVHPHSFAVGISWDCYNYGEQREGHGCICLSQELESGI